MFKHKLEVIERYCEEFGRDPSEIKKTMVIPLRVEKDEKKANQLRKRRGEWGLLGTIPFINDRIQQYIDAGAEEIIFSGVQSKLELFEQVKEEIISAFR
jgi:alkanesulfonate monooxygenase SsuD/methylene tetrahydromethanopterin reductase-like flavin-dependent oxidoreductase (luciferase family)